MADSRRIVITGISRGLGRAMMAGLAASGTGSDHLWSNYRAMPQSPVHPSSLPADEFLRQCDLRFDRRKGPGGQHRNKVETAVVLRHRPSGIQAEAAERRSQQQNRAVALFRLRVKLALELRSPVGEDPSQLWRGRLRAGKLMINPDHTDFPAILAEALDTLHACDYEPKTAAGHLQTTPSQLLRLLKLEPRAFQWLNDQRCNLGRSTLR